MEHPAAPQAFRAGLRRGLDACSSERGCFTVLALDHRQNLRRILDPADPASVPLEAMVALKRDIVRALAPVATGVLLDPEIGAAQCIADGSLPPTAGLLVAVEATGYEGPSTCRRSRVLDGWSVSKVRRMGAAAAKLLVYYHPDSTTARDQEHLLSEVAEACRREDLPLFVEPLTHPVDPDTPKLTGEARRHAVIETARRLTAIGGDVLKAEFPYDAGVTDQGRWREACAELDEASAAPWVLLSGGVDDATFERQVEVACAAGASGALVGRSVWAEAPGLEGDRRRGFLAREGTTRLRRLRDLIDGAGRPWRTRLPGLGDATVADTWCRDYPG